MAMTHAAGSRLTTVICFGEHSGADERTGVRGRSPDSRLPWRLPRAYAYTNSATIIDGSRRPAIAVGTVAGVERRQIHRLDRRDPEPREVIVRQPLIQARRQQERLSTIASQEVLRYPGIVLNRSDDPRPTYATASMGRGSGVGCPRPAWLGSDTARVTRALPHSRCLFARPNGARGGLPAAGDYGRSAG
jgi:hypothetical protein